MSGNEPIAAEGTSATSAEMSGSSWFDVTPGQVSMGIAVGAAFLSASLLSSLFALIWGVPSAVVVGIGVVLGRRRLITYGVGWLFVGIVIAGIQGSSPAVLVPCTILALMAWDSGRYGLTIAEQLGEDARSTRLELGHAI